MNTLLRSLSQLFELLKGLHLRADIEVHLVLLADRILYPKAKSLVKQIHIIERKTKKDFKIFSQFYKLCQQIQPDIIHSWGTMSSIYGIPTAKRLRIPLLSGNIADAPAQFRFLESRLVRAKLTFLFADVVLSNSRAGIDSYGSPVHKSKCIYNGFDINRMHNLDSPQTIRQQLGIKTPKVIAMVGEFYDRKDYKTYIKAAIKVLQTQNEVTFLAIGDGPNLASCKELVPMEYHDKIVFPGRISDVESILNILDVGVLTTNAAIHWEGISNAILEYLFMKIPVIATNGGGTPEILIDGKNGYLIPPNSVDSLMMKINELLDHPEKAKAMGMFGKQFVEQHFSLDEMIDQFITLYEEVLEPVA